ncbi:MAG TPA: aspartate kinase, partial [Parasegetibacter sp.]
MQVFKFGGASINNLERIQQIPTILDRFRGESVLMVISAMGKTTNALEKVVAAFVDGKKDEALHLFNVIKENHLTLAKYLLVKEYNPAYETLRNIFTEAEWLLHDKPVREYDYYYDQIVCTGELMSSALISYYLKEEGWANDWLDVRDVLQTDNNFRDANINWKVTSVKTSQHITPLLSGTKLVITQGFIGSTDDNESTTLGREGSDFTAAVFANILNAEKVVIWKDVPGVMNADPKMLPDAIVIPELNYREVIEMSYYGAQVIHPKTIKPLQNKNIPLLVKCFLDPDAAGTIIHKATVKGLPPVVVLKNNMVLISLNTVDFSFVGEKPVKELYTILGALHIRPALMQNGAVNILCCVDDHPEKIERLALE